MTSQPIQAVLFDMDGVLADSEELWSEIDTVFLKEHGAEYEIALKSRILGTNFPTAIKIYRDHYALKADVDEMVARRHVIANEFYANRIKIFPSAPHVLQTLKERGFPIGLATSAARPIVDPFIARHDLARFFDATTTGDEVANGKPAPDIYLETAEKLGVDPARCLVVEDALSGVQSGKSAGCIVASIPDARWNDVAKFHELADYVLEKLEEVPALIEKLNAKTPAS